MFSERALIRWRDHLRSDGATRFAEVEGGLNGMTIGRFEQVVARSNFDVDFIEPVPIRKLRRLHNRVTREFTTAIVRCRLTKPVLAPVTAETPVDARAPRWVRATRPVRVSAPSLGRTSVPS